MRFPDPPKRMGGGVESLKSLGLARLESCQKCIQRAKYTLEFKLFKPVLPRKCLHSLNVSRQELFKHCLNGNSTRHV